MSTMLVFVLGKKGSKVKKRMKEEEMEKGDCAPARKVEDGPCSGVSG